MGFSRQGTGMGGHCLLRARTTISPSNSTPGYIAEKKNHTNSKRYLHPKIAAALLTIAKIWKQPMDKEVVVLYRQWTTTQS